MSQDIKRYHIKCLCNVRLQHFHLLESPNALREINVYKGE